MDFRKYFLSAVVSVLMLAYAYSTELDSTLLGVMDDYVLTMEHERSSVDFTRDVDVSEPLEKRLSKFKSYGGSGRRTGFDKIRPSGGRGFSTDVESFGSSGPREMYEKAPILRGGGGFFSKRRYELVDKYPTYEERRPKIDFKALLRNLTKGAKKKTKAKIPLNKNLQAMNQIQFGMLEAGAMNEGISTEIIKKHIVEACNANQYMFARKMLGHEIYSSRKTETSSKRSRRGISSTKDILNDIKSKIGKDKYNRLMAYDGGVTLAFALDTTGSMVDDIDAAKTIVFGIVTQNRAFSVDYVLSPFNDPVSDPRHGPVTYKDKTEKYEFLELVSKVDEAGGGDCDELAISGIRDIFSSSLQYRSPIYVLTDAGPKDATEDHLDVVKEMVMECKTPINFFLSNAGCLTNKAIGIYKSLARYSGGQILYFSDKRQIASTTRFIQKGLIGGSSIPVTPARLIKKGRTKRGIIAMEYSITVDDSIDVLSTSIMDRSNIDAQLYSPDGKRQEKGKMSTGRGALFLVDKPTPGIWKIKCPSCSWQSYVTSNSISLENIDFDYSFLVDVEIGGKSTAVSSSYPIKGKDSTVIVTVPAHNRTETSSYKLEVVNDALKTLHTISLKQYGRAPGRYKGSFPTPSSEFQLVLKGKTKKAKPFTRLANGLIRPKSTVIHVFSASKGFAVKAGSKSPTKLTFAIHCFNGKDTYDVKVHESEMFAAKKPKRVTCMPNRMSTFHVSFKAPNSAKKGNIHNVVVTVVSKRHGTKANKYVQLLIM